MAKSYSLSLEKNENININLEQFNKFIRSATSTDDGAGDNLLIALPQSSHCQINPGLAFEILKFDETSEDPGYVKPLGKGRCDIYSESGTTHIKITRNKDINSSFGICQNEKSTQYGPFLKTNEKTDVVTSIYYFNSNLNCPDEVGDNSQISRINGHHTLMLSRKSGTMFILDYEDEAYKKFTADKHWKDIYADKFEFKNNLFTFNNSYINKSETISIADYLPKNTQIKKFICRTKLSPKKEGTQLKLTNGSSVQIPHKNIDNDLMLFHLPFSSFMFLPKESKGQLVIVDTPASLISSNSPKFIGFFKSQIVDPQLDINLFASKKPGSKDEAVVASKNILKMY